MVRVTFPSPVILLQPTWRHVESRTAAKVGGDAVLRGKSKVRKLHSPAVVLDQDVLRLQVPMVDTSGVAMADSIQDLEEHTLGLVVVGDVVAFVGDLGKQISLGTILKNDIRALGAIQDLDHGNHIAVLAGLVVQLDLTILELPLPCIKADLVQSLYGILFISLNVTCSIHSAVRADAQDSGQLNAACQDVAQSILGLT